MQDLVFIHGAGRTVNDPEYGSAQLLRFLKHELARDVRIRAPLMPHPEAPRANARLDALEAELSDLPADAVLVGQSVGWAFDKRTGERGVCDVRECALHQGCTLVKESGREKTVGVENFFSDWCGFGSSNTEGMNGAVFAFRRFEDASRRYTGVDSHPGLAHYGLYDTVVARE